MEKFLLNARLFRQKLDIVDHENIDVAVVQTKAGALVPGGDFTRDHGIDKFVEEIFAGGIEHPFFGGFLRDAVGDRLYEVGFSQPRFPVDKEGVKAFARVFGNRLGGGIDKFVGRADDEGIEGEIFIDGHGLEIVDDVFVLVRRIGVASLYHEAEIVDADVAFRNRIAQGNGVFFHDGVGGEVGGGFQKEPPVGDIDGLEVLNERIERNGRDDSFRFIPNLFP